MSLSQAKNLSVFFIRILFFGAFIPVCIGLAFLYFIIQANEKNIEDHYNEHVQTIEYSLQTTFNRIADSLDKIYQSKTLKTYLNTRFDEYVLHKNIFRNYLNIEKNKAKQLDYSYCIYRSNMSILYNEVDCPKIRFLKHQGALFDDIQKQFVIYKKYEFSSEHGHYPLYIAASVPLKEIKNQFSTLTTLKLNSSDIESISFTVEVEKRLLNLSSLRQIYLIIFGSIIFFLISILYGTRTTYLLKRKAEASLKLATIGKIAHFIAHDIKKPFQNLKLFQKELSLCNSQDQAHKLIQKTSNAILSSQKLIENTLEELIDTNKNQLNIAFHVSLKKIINECFEATKPLNFNHSKIHIELKHSLYLNIDKAQISRALMNLLSNAFDAIQTEPTAVIKVSSYDYNGYVRLIVHNSHSYISKQHQRWIFEPFFSTKENQGSGLGLATTKKFIELHHGKINCFSKEGYGVDFVIDLPANSGTTTIIIDDCPLTLRSWKRYFLQVSPKVSVNTFLCFEEFFRWAKKRNIKQADVIEIICDYCIESSNIPIQEALVKIKRFFKKKVYISTHMDSNTVYSELGVSNVYFLSK